MARRFPWLVLVLLWLGSGAAAAPAEKAPPPKQDYYELYRLLVDTVDHVERSYVKEIDHRELIEAAIDGMLHRLDPYSTYIKPEEIDRFRTSVESEFGGIGIQISMDDGKLTVISPLVGTPAYRAGVLAGDRIVEIDGKSTEDISLDEAIRRLKGKTGTKVTLTLLHPAATENVNVEITREKIHIDTVLGHHRNDDDTWDFMLGDNEHVGYVRVTAFSRDTAREFRTVLERLQKDRLRGLILDLRFNPGGLLSSAVQISDLFIPKGRIVSTLGRNSPERAWDAKKEGTFDGFPMAVLVNRYSASASEIVSACLQDHKRAVVIGERSWGKGSVQNLIELEYGRSALKLTTAAYHRPSGKNIHRFSDAKDGDEWGVMPDAGFRVRLDDAEMLKLIHDRRRRDVVRRNHAGKDADNAAAEESGEPAKKPEKVEDSQKTDQPPFVDRQLQKAMEYLTSELARVDAPVDSGE